jgi:hypothetical protein
MTNDQKQLFSTEYYGYTIRQHPESGQWEVLWQEERQAGDFATRAQAEEWIDDLIPLNR